MFKNRRHAPQANAELWTIELQRTVCRLLQNAGERCLHFGSSRHTQFDMQRERVRLSRAVWPST